MNNGPETDPETALTTFGFTQTESLLYCELLQNSPATGYRLAQQIGRAPANIYQSLKALVQKGAVLVNQTPAEAVSYIPVPPEQLFAALGRSYADRQRSALASLARVHTPIADVIVSQLRTR